MHSGPVIFRTIAHPETIAQSYGSVLWSPRGGERRFGHNLQELFSLQYGSHSSVALIQMR
jgi:hypothetical protein